MTDERAKELIMVEPPCGECWWGNGKGIGCHNNSCEYREALFYIVDVLDERIEAKELLK